MYRILPRLVILAVIGGGFLMYMAYREWRLSSTAASAPEDLTLAALIARGPEGNPYVRVSDFDTGRNFVYQPGKYGGGWETVWVPAAPVAPGARPEEMDDIKMPELIIKSSHVHSQADLDALVVKPTLEGMVINSIESLGSEEKKHLSSHYPYVGFDKCLILDEGRKPSGAASVFLMGGGGLALVVGGVGAIVYMRTRRPG
jgi:hypothetical protein